MERREKGVGVGRASSGPLQTFSAMKSTAAMEGGIQGDCWVVKSLAATLTAVRVPLDRTVLG